MDLPLEERDIKPPSLKDKVLNVAGQVTAIIASSLILLLLIPILGAACAHGERWVIIAAPCVMLFAFGWFLNDWLSPLLVWICWLIIGLLLLITGNLGELPTVDELTFALAAIPTAMALPVICGIYFGRTKKLYLFLIPLLAYAALFWIISQISTAA